jgi:hypothetical protein
MAGKKLTEFSEQEISKLFAFNSIKRNKNRMKILPAIVYRLANFFFNYLNQLMPKVMPKEVNL